ncbi:hypothetical protein [Komagataeibacter xylinus]|uniref:hypothetical protein n=1 Tax=Komagataeibacter xylinus TaxID=28448 RepID=UPI00280C35BE|nr:hypothetical protein [Komagataeibacter xylinus]
MSKPTYKKRYGWSKFWWKDWQNDLALKSCSYAARGLWMEMLAIMHAAERIGFFEISGKKVGIKQLAGLTNGSDREVRKLLSELQENNVFSVDEDGFIFSRRMVRDKENSDISAEYGRSGGNPSLTKNDDKNSKGGVNPPDKGADKPRDKLKKLEARNNPIVPLISDADEQTLGFEDFWSAYPKKVGKGAALKAFEKARQRVDVQTLLDAIAGTSWSEDHKFIPHASTWLNGERWADEGVLLQQSAAKAQFDLPAYEEAARKWAKSGFEGSMPLPEHFPLKEAVDA